MSPALAGRFLTTAPPGKSLYCVSYDRELKYVTFLSVCYKAAVYIIDINLTAIEFEDCENLGKSLKLCESNLPYL